MAQSAYAGIPFTENWDEPVPPPTLDGTDYIRDEIMLFGAFDLFERTPLFTFSPELLLPVSNGGDLELLWDNEGFGDSGSLAVTPDDEDGNYPFMGVRLETVFAMEGDIEGALPEAGVVLRHTGPRFPDDRKFYAAYAQIVIDEGLKVEFHMEKWIGAGVDAFLPLDSGLAVTDRFDFAPGENFRIIFEVSEPDDDLVCQLAARFERLKVDDGVLKVDELATLSGLDSDYLIGQVGLYARAGSVSTKIAFDDGTLTFLHAPVKTTVDFKPEKLNIRSKGKWVTCYIELEDYDVDDIDVSTVRISDINGYSVDIPAESHPTGVGDHDNDGIPDLMVKFDREEVLIGVGPCNHPLSIKGQLTNGVSFEGSDSIKMINPGK